MQPIYTIILKSVLTTGLMLAYYFLALRNRRLHTFNRFYLLATVLVSILIPFLHFDLYTIKEASSSTAINILQVINSGTDEVDVVSGQPDKLSIETILGIAYSMVSLAIMALTIGWIAWIYKLKRENRVVPHDGYNLVFTGPFSERLHIDTVT